MFEFLYSLVFRFESGALNATLFVVLTIVIPAALMAHTAITLNNPTRSKLLFNGGGLIAYCLLVAPLLLVVLDTIGNYEREYETCQLNYVYTKLSEPEAVTDSLPKCERRQESINDELKDFKTFMVIISLFVNVVLLSLSVNLISSASTMSSERMCQDNIHSEIDHLSSRIRNLASNVKVLTVVLVVLLVISIALVLA
ncbi:hypothetical protein ACQKPX_21095 [Photobacterium sp. DNB23_23_1]